MTNLDASNKEAVEKTEEPVGEGKSIASESKPETAQNS